MAKWCFNYESGEYEYIEKDGFSIDRGEYVYNWDDSEYRHDDEEEECRNSLFDDEDERHPKPGKRGRDAGNCMRVTNKRGLWPSLVLYAENFICRKRTMLF